MKNQRKMNSCKVILCSVFGFMQIHTHAFIENWDDKIFNEHQTGLTEQQITEQFESAYLSGDSVALNQIFLDWNQAFEPNSEAYMHRNDTVEALYNIFREFYQPFEVVKIGHWYWSKNIKSKFKYLVVQQVLLYMVLAENQELYTLPDIEDYDSLPNFRPTLKQPKGKVLYLNREYTRALYKFLGTESTELGEENIMNPARPKGESRKRHQALLPYIPIVPGHWGGYWHLETHPFAIFTELNHALDYAHIHFRLGYRFGDAYFMKIFDTWIQWRYEITGIE